MNISYLYNAYAINKDTNYDLNDIVSFFDANKNVLTLDAEELDKELSHNWTYNKFIKLLECIYVLSNQDYNLKWYKNWNQTQDPILEEIDKYIFWKYNFERLFEEFIVPKALKDKNIEFLIPEEERKYIAYLTYSQEETTQAIELLESIFNFNHDTTLERRRSMRKRWLEVLFTWLLKNPIFSEEWFKQFIYEKMDEALKQERLKNTSRELWSLHNVIHSFISGKCVYKTQFYNFDLNNSHYNFLQVVPELMSILYTNIKSI